MDPQDLDFLGYIGALWSLGRVPLACEVPMWTVLGCLVSSQIFPAHINASSLGFLRGFDWWATLQCGLVTWGTNVAINYGNEYFDWDLDRPGQVAAMKRDIDARQKEKAKKDAAHGTNGNGAKEVHNEENGAVLQMMQNEKIYGNTTRIIHDGTLPPWTALLCSIMVELLLVGLILYSRSTDPILAQSAGKFSSATRPGVGGTPFRGLGIQIGFFCTTLSHSYVGPPLRLHYNGWGELVSALFLSPVAFIFGLVGHYTATSGNALVLSNLYPSSYPNHFGFNLDKQIWTLIAAFYFLEQGRIFIMHVHDIETDIAGGKRTYVSRVGRRGAKNHYAVFSIVSFVLFGTFAASLAYDEPADVLGRQFLKVGGVPLAGAAGAAFSAVWSSGLTLVLAFSIPIAAITYSSIAKEIQDKEPKSWQSPETVANGPIPTMPMTDCALLVSLQTLATPAFLILTTLTAGFMASRAGHVY